jgi:glutamine amidotransferase-like uncharacterized protein
MNSITSIVYGGRGALNTPFPPPFLSLEKLLEGSWADRYSIFIMPGGRDLPYHLDLKGRGNERISEFVKKGGVYVGLCAGAYYGCERVEFDRGLPLEVCGNRELKFFSGTAVGPAYGKGTFDYKSSAGARAAKLILPDHTTLHVYYNGGCTFEGDLTQCKVLARYADLPCHPPAIIECQVGKGRAVLSGVHLETSPSDLDRQDPYLAPLISVLEESEEKRVTLWDHILKPSDPRACRR